MKSKGVSHRSLLRKLNEPEELKKHHRMYINMARIGEMDHYVGIDWLFHWYERNLILFSNLARLAESPDDRILLIIGGAHVQILQQFIAESGCLEIEPALSYLA
ncbi:DUF5694 domain-containing protein [Paenibacillus dendritiformis]|uniref:DUF5694 domain-containing protein n=1 Tax=Paenibacillus dendritiformis TaxID=130049 RepID=UPI00387E1ADB